MKINLKFLLVLIVSCISTLASASITSDTLGKSTLKVDLLYLNRNPFFFESNGAVIGIEREILHQFVSWARSEKNLEVIFALQSYSDFAIFLEACKTNKGEIIGSGTVTIKPEREELFHFTPPYLKNVSVLVSHGSLRKLDGVALKGAAVENAIHRSHLNELSIKKNLTITPISLANQLDLPNTILKDNEVIGYMDLLNYWSFLKNNPTKFLRIHRAENRDHEAFGFVSNKNSQVAALLDEFFNAGFGFTATRKYDAILKKYLGPEVLNAVEID